MSLRETLEEAVAKLSAVHENNRLEYRAALEAVDEANRRKRVACDRASVSANELGAATKALEELNRNTPAKVVEASGEMQAGEAEASTE